MSETVRSMLVYGIASIRAGEIPQGRRYLERALSLDGDLDQIAQAHLWLSRTTEDPDEKRNHLESVLATDPTHAEAHRELAILDGRLDPSQIVDPNLPPPHPADGVGPTEPRPVEAARMVCPRCAGRMRFEPAKAAVECAYCGYRAPIPSAVREGGGQIEEEDFVVALATTVGHTLPAGTRVYHCQGCQATLVAALELSARCPYCGSSHVVEVDSPAMVRPEGLIPFAVEATQAQRAFRTWLDHKLGDRQVQLTKVRGLYLPMWTFDLMGNLGWRGVEADNHDDFGSLMAAFGGVQARHPHRVPGSSRVHEGEHYVLAGDIVVPATHRVPYALHEVFEHFHLDATVPYDPAYLADWPAEIYEITVSNASLVARRRALDHARSDVERQAESEVGNLRDLKIFSRSLSVQAYKLLLVPVWIANYRYEDNVYTVAISGQTAEVVAEEPPGIVRRFLNNMLGTDD